MDCCGDDSEEPTARCIQREVEESDSECGEAHGKSGHAYGVEPLGSVALGRDEYLNMAERLSCMETKIDQMNQDLDLVRNDGTNQLKQRLVDITKKNRKLQVTTETQKSRSSNWNQSCMALMKASRSELKKMHTNMQT